MQCLHAGACLKGCNEEDKRKILDSYIDFDDCTLEELLGDVKKSRLYPKEKIDSRVKEIIWEKNETWMSYEMNSI